MLLFRLVETTVWFLTRIICSKNFFIFLIFFPVMSIRAAFSCEVLTNLIFIFRRGPFQSLCWCDVQWRISRWWVTYFIIISKCQVINYKILWIIYSETKIFIMTLIFKKNFDSFCIFEKFMSWWNRDTLGWKHFGVTCAEKIWSNYEK